MLNHQERLNLVNAYRDAIYNSSPLDGGPRKKSGREVAARNALLEELQGLDTRYVPTVEEN